MTETIELLMALWPWGYGEMRSYGQGTGVAWVVADDRAAIRDMLDRALRVNEKKRHIAHGINPRHRLRHPCGRGKDVSFYTTIVFDFDTGREVDAGLSMLTKLGLEPSVLVHSGRGMHVYLLLDKPTRVEFTQPVARALGNVIGGDRVFDPARIMRTPGTINWRSDTRTAIIRADYDRRYAVEDLADRITPPSTAGRPPPAPPCAFRQTDTLLDKLLTGDTSRYRSRSEGTMAAARRLKLLGYSHTKALGVMMDSPLAKRSEDDIIRCLDKTYKCADETWMTRIVIIGQRKIGGIHSIKLEALDEPFLGHRWWQRITGVESHVERCMTPRVTAQGQGWARLVWETYQGRQIPKVFFFVPRQ